MYHGEIPYPDSRTAGQDPPRCPGSAPARQRTCRKKVNPFVLFLRGLARRLYFGIKTAFKFLLFVPVLVFMVAFSYNVDRSGCSRARWHPAASLT